MFCLHVFVSEELRRKYGRIFPGLLPSSGLKPFTMLMHTFSKTGVLPA